MMMNQSARIVVVTMMSGHDQFPIDLMVAHRLRMLSGAGITVSDMVVLDNQPPWIDVHDTDTLGRFRDSNLLRFVKVDYALLNDSSFLRRFFVCQSSVVSAAGHEAWTTHIGAFLNVSRLAEGGVGTSGLYTAAHVMGMLHFLKLCILADKSVDLCVYTDADIFLYRSGHGIANLASAIFRRSPELVVLQPPTVCHSFESLDIGNGECRTEAIPWCSSRHMIVNRSRLLRLLPLHAPIEDLLVLPPTFEVVFSNALVDGMVGQMHCGGETFAIHPPSRFVRREFWEYQRENVPVMSVEEHLDCLIRSEHGEKAALYTARDGVGILIERIERGHFALPSGILYVGGVLGGQEPLAVNGCDDMVPSVARIKSGLAW